MNYEVNTNITKKVIIWNQNLKKRTLFNVNQKLFITLMLAAMWLAFSCWAAIPWYYSLSEIVTPVPAFLIIAGLALIPGLANSFLVGSILFDNRPTFSDLETYPPITVLIAAYNEEDCIGETIESIVKQEYPGKVVILVGDDGSTDTTRARVYEKHLKYKHSHPNIKISIGTVPNNIGKGGILNEALKRTKTEYCLTIDADTYLYKDALKNIVNNIIQGPPNTAAVAGSVLVRNSRNNWLTKVQEWDYYHGIAVVKRIQSLYQGTLVAQGAFSIYRTDVLKELGGWDNTVGEDIVLTWAIRKLGYRVSYDERAIAFTNVPEKYSQFFRQRKRWARGLIEAFKKYPGVIWQINKTTPFVLLNLTFPFNDFIFLFAFLPGVFAAIFFQYYAIAGVMTVILLPMALMMNWLIYYKHTKTFREMGLGVRKNKLGFISYILAYQTIMVPASLAGYFAEFLKLKKSWGTK